MMYHLIYKGDDDIKASGTKENLEAILSHSRYPDLYEILSHTEWAERTEKQMDEHDRLTELGEKQLNERFYAKEEDRNYDTDWNDLRPSKLDKPVQALDQETINRMNQDDHENPGGKMTQQDWDDREEEDAI